jgi:hypothetical protein
VLFGACPPQFVRGAMLSEELSDPQLERDFVDWQKRHCVASLKEKWHLLMATLGVLFSHKACLAYSTWGLLPVVS